MKTAADLRTEEFFLYNGFVHKVIEKDKVSSSVPDGTVRIRTFNFDTGETATAEIDRDRRVKTSKLTEKELRLKERKKNSLLFADEENDEEIEVDASLLGQNNVYLQGKCAVSGLFYKDMFVGVDLPKVMSMTVESTEDTEKKGPVTDYVKDARLSNGCVIKVPSFIKNGDHVLIYLDNGEYIRRDE
ncbi:MAG: hypothetical protein R6V47_02820 [Candidatus Delongbacteria bacterium]